MNDLIERLEELRQYLDGAGALDGYWFGCRNPSRKGMYWWRKELPRIDKAITALREQEKGLSQESLSKVIAEQQTRIAELEADLDALNKWPTWKEQCNHIHALTNERLRLDAALGEIESYETYDPWDLTEIARKARAGE